jgi:arylsulfatase A-like enzyme
VSPLSRRDLLRAGGAGAAGLAAGAAGYALLESGAEQDEKAAGEEPRNVIVVVIDNLRADHVGAYGSRTVRTPSLDALAEEGLRFTAARPEAFPTVAARRAILTGRRSFPFRDWRADPDLPQTPSWSPIAPNQPTFLQILGQAGYTTGYVTDNPWILSKPYDRFRRTVDIVETIPGQVPGRGGPRRRVSDEELRRSTLPAQRGKPVEGRIREFLAATAPDRREDDYPAARVFAQASRWLTRSPPGKPFALVVDAFTPHEPFDPPPSFVGMYGQAKFDGPEPVQPFAPPIGTLEAAGITDRVLQRIRDLYAAEVTFTDRWLGNFLDELARGKLAEATHVVLLSDHGMLLGEHGFVGKRGAEAYRQVTDVPFIIRHADGTGAGKTSGYFASTHDVAPTVLSMLGLTPPGRMAGEDLSVTLEGDEPPPRSLFTAGYDNAVLAGDDRYLLLADNEGNVRRLYDAEGDPRQRKDVSGQKPQVTARLWQALLDDAGGTLPRFDATGAVSG